MPGSVAESHVEDILGCPTQRWGFAAGWSRRLIRNRNYLGVGADNGNLTPPRYPPQQSSRPPGGGGGPCANRYAKR